MPAETTTVHRRRSQAERSATTREALLDATIECLVEDGYANTTTSRVAERAGLSRGAHLHHFQTRDALVAAAMERLAQRRGEVLLAEAEKLPAGRERLARGLDLLWSGYASPLYQAALDLWTHARTDPDLRERLALVERDLDRQTLRVGRTLFGELAERPGFDRLIELSAATMRGLALLDTLHPGGSRNRKQWDFCREMLVRMFEHEL
ncbi:MAG TPA: TetR/AcrR family transcriptional regulator [Solirubrobacteraceae bacterium]|jgi:AcrR family transcriptional regulator|nr:TetR/AcrR family transcriptional regulator [Solirubrobacteraceae bacterium]